MMRDRKKKPFDPFLSLSPHIRWLVLMLIVAVFAIGHDPDLVMKKHRYRIGDIAQADIKAPDDFFIEDKTATESHRRQAVESLATVYDFNPKILKGTVIRVNDAFAQLRAILLEESARQQTDRPPTGDRGAVEPAHFPDLPPVSLKERMGTRKALFEERIGSEIDNDAFSILVDQGFSQETAKLLATILTQILTTGVVANKELLLKESERGIVLRNLETLTETQVTNLRTFYGPDQAKTMVRVIGDPLLKGTNHLLRDVVVDLCQRLIQPNITANSHETEARKKTAEEQIKPVLYMIKKGEMLLREGERVTPLQLQKLHAVEEQVDGHRLPLAGSGAVVLVTVLLIVQYRVRLTRRTAGTSYGNRDLLFFGSVLVTFILVAKLSTTLPDTWFFGLPLARPTPAVSYGIPLAAGAMIVCLFMGLETALIFSLALSLTTAMLLRAGLETFVYFILSCTLACWWLRECRERKVIIETGAKVGLANGLLAVAINVYLGTASWATLPFDATIAFFGGVGAGVITAGLAPVVEMLFRYTTDITLLELANLDRPILRQLMLEAPGTYHHSMVVGSLVEAAASEIGANPILAKVCGYYHDIGKLKQPIYFIENQSDGRNRHDKLAPSMSALILIAHVKNGVELAREHKLGQAIMDAIQQHHGSSLITYFYEKAKAVRGDEGVNIDDFRYPGPRPQTREAGLVMLADVVEAASRTLENPTPSRIQGLVQNLINKIFSDGQLDHCELTLKDLHLIAKSFNKILNGIHHHRIDYPEKTATGSGKAKNGSADRKPPGPPSPVKPKHPEDRDSRIKRLGIS